jgi:POT family proton-dependent oligopeptide transporter
MHWYKETLPKWVEYAVYIGTLVIIPVIQIMVSKPEYTDYFMYTIGSIDPDISFMRCQKLRRKSVRSYGRRLSSSYFLFFWGIYEQSGGSLSIFAAKNLNDNLLGMTMILMASIILPEHSLSSH